MFVVGMRVIHVMGKYAIKDCEGCFNSKQKALTTTIITMTKYEKQWRKTNFSSGPVLIPLREFDKAPSKENL